MTLESRLKGRRVFVYRNLTKGCYSVMSRCRKSDGHNDYGIVIAHVGNVILDDVSFVVNQKGRQRVLRDRRKNVHAGVLGRISYADYGGGMDVGEMDYKVNYNPYRNAAFCLDGTDVPVVSAATALLTAEGAFVEKAITNPTI